MANVFTEVPREEVPPLQPLADVFMATMLSRPSGGSLRGVWVTPATLWLTALAALVTCGVVIWLGVSVADPSAVVLGVVAFCALTTVGAASVAFVGISQRLGLGPGAR